MTDQLDPNGSLQTKAINKRLKKINSKIAADKKALTRAARVNKEIKKLEAKIIALKASPHYLAEAKVLEKQLCIVKGQDELAKIENQNVLLRKSPQTSCTKNQKVSD